MKPKNLRNKLHIPFAILFSYSLFFLLLLIANPTNMSVNGKNVIGISAISFFVENWKNFLIIATPIISIYLFIIILDKKYVETLFSNESGNIFLTFIMVLTLLFTLTPPIEFNLADQPLLFFSLIYLITTSVICFLSHNKTIRAIFGVSSVLLVILILFELMQLRYGIIVGDEIFAVVFCQTGWFDCKWFYVKRIIFLVIILFGFSSLSFIRKKL